MNINLIIIGNGEHSKVVIDAVLKNPDYNYKIGIIDDFNTSSSKQACRLGKDRDLITVLNKYPKAKCIFGIGNSRLKEDILNKLKLPDNKFVSIIHPSSVIASNVSIANGSFIGAGAIIQTNAKIGSHCIINTGAIIEHDCSIADYSHIAPGSILGGGCHIGKSSLIGIGAKIKDHITIGDHVTIGVGAVVIDNISDGITAVGVPAKPIRGNK